MEFRWNPTPAQRELFEEWRNFTIGYLVTCKEGTNIRQIPSFLEEHVGEEVPYQKMGFKSINLFLYAMNECIEVRKIDFKIFIFIREGAVPENLIHVRKLVNGQAKDKGCKTKSGVIKRPTKSQSMYCRAEELLSASQYRPPSATSSFGVNNRPVVVPQSSYGRRPPSRGSYAGSRPSNFSTSRSGQLPPRMQNRTNLTTTRPTSSYSAPVRRPVVQPTSSSSSSSAAARYVYLPPKPSSSGKENVPKPAVVDSSWDSWSTPGNTTRTVTPGGPPEASASSQGPMRYRNIAGLVDDYEDDLGYSDDSDGGFDYCGEPIKKSARDTFQVTVTKTPSVTANQPATVGSTRSTSGTTTIASMQAKFTSMTPVPEKVEESNQLSNGNGGSSSLPTRTISGFGRGIKLASASVQTKPLPTTSSQPVSTFSPTSHVSSVPKQPSVTSSVPTASKPASVTSSIPSASKLTTSTSVSSAPKAKSVTSSVSSAFEPVKLSLTETPPVKRQASAPKPMRTVCLDAENTIYQHDILKNGTVRIMLNFPKVQFPAFFRGGSVKANMSLKSYLASLGKC